MLNVELNSFAAALHGPLNVFVSADSRLFWLFCLSSLGFALVAIWQQSSQRSLKALYQLVWMRMLSQRIWLNKSTAVDIASLFVNSALRTVLIIPLVGGHLAFALVVARALQGNFGTFIHPELPWYGVATLFTLTFFVVEDCSRFGLHWLMHRVPLLWRFHRFHHSAEQLTPLTLYRVHPVEMTLYYLRGLLVFGLVSGVFIYLFGKNLNGWQLLGVDALGFLFNFFAANLRHSSIWLTFGPLERWLVSPAQHQLHHSRLKEHRNRNFGTCLTLWDRIMGTHMVAAKRPQNLQFGLADAIESSSSLTQDSIVRLSRSSRPRTGNVIT